MAPLASLREEHERNIRRGWIKWAVAVAVAAALGAMWAAWFREQAERGFARAAALLERGEYEPAKEQLQALLAMRPDFPMRPRLAEIHDGLGAANLFLRDDAEAKRHFDAAVALGPKPLLAPEEICRRLIARGDYGRCRLYLRYLDRWADDAPYRDYYDAYIKNALDLHLAAEGTFARLKDHPEFGEAAQRHLRYIEFKKQRGLAIRFLDRKKRTALAEDYGLEEPVVPTTALWPLVGRAEWKDDGMWKLLSPYDRPNRMHLTLDLDVQQAASEALAVHAKGAEGALVALDPATGGLLAVASHPDVWRPFMPERRNLAFLRYRPAASTSKPLIAAKALDAGFGADGLFPHTCEGAWRVEGGGTVSCPFGAHGRVASVEEAVALSCNTAFARLAAQAGEGAVVEAWREAGIEDAIGIEPWPALGLGLKTTPTAARGEPVSVGAGIGAPVVASPLMVARMALGLPLSRPDGDDGVRVSTLYLAMQAAAWAGNGTMPLPYLIAWKGNLLDEPYEKRAPAPWRRIASPAAAARMREAMRLAVEHPKGTARDMRDAAVPVAVKTGSFGDLAKGGGWVIGWAPRENPKIAFAVLVDGKGVSGRAATPAARNFLERLHKVGVFKESPSPSP